MQKKLSKCLPPIAKKFVMVGRAKARRAVASDVQFVCEDDVVRPRMEYEDNLP